MLCSEFQRLKLKYCFLILLQISTCANTPRRKQNTKRPIVASNWRGRSALYPSMLKRCNAPGSRLRTPRARRASFAHTWL